MKNIIRFFLIFLYLSISHTQASDNCRSINKKLTDEILDLCSSFQSIESIDAYEKTKKRIHRARVEYYNCQENSQGKDENRLKVYTSSMHVLSEIKFFLRLRDKWKENPVAWLAVEEIISEKIASKCDQFISEALGH